ncbi:MAG: hypothetical protein OEY65_09885, partial [Gammaproteobacteria bacterium]|nr:hypothetical protein [Gammaproteobacteria bacterium]
MQHSQSSSIPFQFEALKIHLMQGQQDLLALHQNNPERYPFLLESVASSLEDTTDKICSSRFDILFAFPQETLTLSNDEKLTGYGDIDGNDFLNNLSNWWKTKRNNLIECQQLPFSGGWFLYLGYELAKQVERQLKLKISSTPIAYATRIPAAIIYDHKENNTYCICEDEFDYLEQLKTDVEKTLSANIKSSMESQNINEENESQYLQSINKVKQYIVDGDVFQV